MTHRQYQCTTLIHTNLTFWYERNFREMKLKIKTVITSVTLSILVARTQWKSLSHPFRLYVIHLNVLMKREIGMNERERASANTNTNATIRHSYANGIRAKANVEPRFIVIDAVNRMAYFRCLFSCSCSHSYSPERVYECLLACWCVCVPSLLLPSQAQTGALILFWCLFHAPKTCTIAILLITRNIHSILIGYLMSLFSTQALYLFACLHRSVCLYECECLIVLSTIRLSSFLVS